MPHFIGKLLSMGAIFLGLGIGVNYAHSSEKKAVDIHVGIYAPFSNRHAFIGRNILGAMELARDKTSNSTINYTFYTLDELPTTSLSAKQTIQKFIEFHKINVLVTEGSENGLLAAPIVKQNNIIHFSMASDPHIADGVNNFLTWSPEYEQAMVMVNKLKQEKIKRIGVIASDKLSDQVLTKSILTTLKKNSAIKVLNYAQIKANTKNYASLIQQLKAKNPELYLIMASPGQIERIQQAMNKAHINKPVTSIVERVTPKVMTIFNGQWFIDTHEMKPEFINEYQENYFNYPTTEAGYAYDMFNLINKSVLASIKKKQDFSNASLARQIHVHLSGEGVMGPYNLGKDGVLYTQSDVKKIVDGHVLTA